MMLDILSNPRNLAANRPTRFAPALLKLVTAQLGSSMGWENHLDHYNPVGMFLDDG